MESGIGRIASTIIERFGKKKKIRGVITNDYKLNEQHLVDIIAPIIKQKHRRGWNGDALITRDRSRVRIEEK